MPSESKRITLKNVLSTVVALIVVLAALLYLNRQSILLRYANPALAPYGVSLSCAEFKFLTTGDIFFNRLCFDHAQANGVIYDATVKWSKGGSYSLDRVTVEQLDLNTTGGLVLPAKGQEQPFKLDQLNEWASQICRMFIATAIDVNVFTLNPSRIPSQYYGRLKADRHSLAVSLNQAHSSVVRLSVERGPDQLAGQLAIEPALLKQLVIEHGDLLPESLTNVAVQGSLQSQFQWRDNRWQIETQLFDFKIDNGDAKVSFNAQPSVGLVGEKVSVTFSPEDHIEVDITPSMIASLSPAIGQLYQANPFSSVFAKPAGQWHFQPESERLTLDKLWLLGKSTENTLQIELNDGQFNMKDGQFDVEVIAQGQSTVPQLNDYTQQPVSWQTTAILKHSAEQTQLQFEPSSLVLDALALIGQRKVSAESAEINWHGSATLAEALSGDIQAEIKLSQPVVEGLGQLDELQIKADIKGVLEAFELTGKALSGEQVLASVKASGEIAQPQIDVSGKALELTTLLDYLVPAVRDKLEAELIDGTVDYAMQGQLTQPTDLFANTLQGQVKLNDITGQIAGNWVESLAVSLPFELASGQLKVESDKQNLSIGHMDVGVPIDDFKASLGFELVQPTFSLRLDNASGKAFGGQWQVDRLQWPSNPETPVIFQLTEWDLTKLVALEQQKGITVTGLISGELPIFWSANGVTIAAGDLTNASNGIIQIKDNPAVDELKQTNDQLKLAFDALENLHYHQLGAPVTMGEDMRMTMPVAIKGVNPDLDAPVNLNLNLNYDLGGMIESLRLTQVLESRISEKIEQYMQQKTTENKGDSL